MNASTERSLFFLKPPHSQNPVLERHILSHIFDKNLRIVFKDDRVITKSILDALYGHVDKPVYDKLSIQMLDMVCPLYVVEGVNAIEKVVTMVGEKTAPKECAAGSLRMLEGDYRPGFEHLNVAHRPKTLDEVTANLRAFELERLILTPQPA